MEDLTETEGREIALMEVTGKTIEIDLLEVTETEKTEDIIDPKGDMTGIIIMIGTTEKEGEGMGFS